MGERYETLILEIDAGLAELRFNRPAQYNALNERMALELADALAVIEGNPAVRALLLTGCGEAFHAGGDVKAFAEAGPEAPAFVARLVGVFHRSVLRLLRLPMPVVAAVNGVAAGAGFSLAMACDLVLARADARFTVAYTGIGATPDGGGTWSLVRLVGMRRALELVYTNRVLTAQEALEWGLVNRVLPEPGFAEESRAVVQLLAAGPSLALKKAKQLLHAGWSNDLERQLALEGEALVACAGSSDFAEGVRAFGEKRAPHFKGE